MSPESSGRRLDAQARRAQLVAAGLELMGSVPVDQLSADDIARASGVSKGLVFHYFPTTRDLQEAILRSATEELLANLIVDPEASHAEQLRLGIEAFISYIEMAPANYLAMARGWGSDTQLGAVFEEARETVVGLVHSVLGVEALPVGLVIALRGWIAFVEEASLQWLAHDRPISRDALVGFMQATALVWLLPEALAIDALR